MRIVEAKNVNDAWPQALRLLDIEGARAATRNGAVVVHPQPVATVYRNPTQRVLFDSVRDANPIFHLHEALWMLAGRDDATWLDQFVSNFSSRFAEGNGVMHGAYGARWRETFTRLEDDRSTGRRSRVTIDQLDEAVRLLRANPDDRQAVIQMWDAPRDLGIPGLKDRPCNTHIYLRCDREDPYQDPPVTDQNSAEWELRIAEGRVPRLLDMTVCCRSNDVVYGCYGANVVHFSILQEYLAARIGVGVGRYTQISNNFHLYEETRGVADPASAERSALLYEMYPGTFPLVKHPDSFDDEVRQYVEDPSSPRVQMFSNPFFKGVAYPMYAANTYRREKLWAKAKAAAAKIAAEDWRLATALWLERRGG